VQLLFTEALTLVSNFRQWLFAESFTRHYITNFGRPAARCEHMLAHRTRTVVWPAHMLACAGRIFLPALPTVIQLHNIHFSHVCHAYLLPRTCSMLPGVRTHAHASASLQQQQQNVARRYVAAAAASSDEQEPLIDVEAATVSSSSSRGTSSSSSRSPLDDMAQAAAGVVEDASDVASATVNAAAEAASEVVSDASDVASALVGDAAAAASAAAAGGEAGGPAIDWQSSSGSAPDNRFIGMKVLVVGATGGVGR
jgi:hypothetical protein